MAFGMVPAWVEWFETVAKIGGAFLVVGAIAATRPMRWLVHQVFAEPAGEWLDKRISSGVCAGMNAVKGDLAQMRVDIEQVRDELTTNSGASLKDEVGALRNDLGELVNRLPERSG